MSLHVIGFTCEYVFIAADKRVSKSADLSFVNDEAVKVHRVRDNIYFNGGCAMPQSEAYNKVMDSYKHLPATQLIEIVRSFDRRFKTIHEEHITSMYLTGFDENNNFFMWIGLPGSDKEELICNIPNNVFGWKIFGMTDGKRFGQDNKINTIVEVDKYLKSRLSSQPDKIAIIQDCITYGASIDKVVSPTYDTWYFKRNNLKLN